MKLSAMQIQAIVDATKTPTPEQVRVVEAPRRPLLVVAGAGSGKTETMSMRVLWLLANYPDLTPASILGLTFTRRRRGSWATACASVSACCRVRCRRCASASTKTRWP